MEGKYTKRVPLICRSTSLEGKLWTCGENKGVSRKYLSRCVCIWVEISIWKLVYKYGDREFVILNGQLLGSYQNA